MQTRTNKKAFTLVELLLVVTIIGILAGAVMVNFSGETEKARVVRAKTDIRTLGTCLSAYEMNMGAYPTMSQGLRALIEDPGVEGWKRFLSTKTYKDPWGNDYHYVFPGTHDNEYDLFSMGSDGQEGTADDIGNWVEDES